MLIKVYKLISMISLEIYINYKKMMHPLVTSDIFLFITNFKQKWNILYRERKKKREHISKTKKDFDYITL